MFRLAKIACVCIYLYAFMHQLTPLPAGYFVGIVALILIAAHLLELVIAFRHVKKYPGNLAVSMLLTLLFGLLHWHPLKKLP